MFNLCFSLLTRLVGSNIDESKPMKQSISFLSVCTNALGHRSSFVLSRQYKSEIRQERRDFQERGSRKRYSRSS